MIGRLIHALGVRELALVPHLLFSDVIPSDSVSIVFPSKHFLAGGSLSSTILDDSSHSLSFSLYYLFSLQNDLVKLIFYFCIIRQGDMRPQLSLNQGCLLLVEVGLIRGLVGFNFMKHSSSVET